LVGRIGDALKEEVKPSLPRATLADFLQGSVIVGSVRLQIKAEIKKWFTQYAASAQIERYQ
jgi:hypothetical protein